MSARCVLKLTKTNTNRAMKKSYYSLAAVAAVFFLVSCEYEELPSRDLAPVTLSMPVSDVVIPVQTLDTKAFMDNQGDSWMFKWENGDIINYIVTRNGSYVQSGYGTVVRTLRGTDYNFSPSEPLQTGDMIYTYYTGDIADEHDPTNVTLYVPSMQSSYIGWETYSVKQSYSETVTDVVSGTLELVDISLDALQAMNTSSATPASREISFSIQDYSPELNYTYSLDGRTYYPLTVSASGEATVDYDFSQINFLVYLPSLRSLFGINGGGYVGYSTKSLFVKCESGSAATISLSVVGAKSSSSGSARYSYNYSVLRTSSGSYNKEVIRYINEVRDVLVNERQRVIGVRDCMPMVGTPIKVTSSMAAGRVPFTNSLNFKMVGSLIQFNIYSLDPDVAVGEKIKSVTFEADHPIAGTMSYDLTSTTATLTGASEYSIYTDVDDVDVYVPDNDTYAALVYMVVAPSTTLGSYDVETSAHHYLNTFTESKTYSANKRKKTSVNLGGTSYQMY